jgi:inner membrane protein
VDNVTHALAGLLLADTVVATQRRRGRAIPDAARGAIAVAGVITAELPDIDLAWSGLGRGAETLGYMLHHRGHTHTVLVALAGALLVWGAALALRPALRTRDASRTLLATCVLGTLSHLLLDWTNSYGVHPFWPFEGRWYYGDAVFIVEPWLWVVAIPAALLGERARWTRVVLALLLIAILGLAWGTDNVARGMATLLTLGTAVTILAARATHGLARPALAIGAWVMVEATFFVGARAAEGRVRAIVSAPEDVVLTPGAADPLCWSALVVTEDGPAATYRVRGAVVRPFPGLRRDADCRVRSAAGLDKPPEPPADGVRWTGEWRGPVAELRTLARTDCRLAAALRFMRVPAWRRTARGTELWDLRYGAGGFASVRSDGGRPCPETMPEWTPPRRRLLDGPLPPAEASTDRRTPTVFSNQLTHVQFMD